MFALPRNAAKASKAAAGKGKRGVPWYFLSQCVFIGGPVSVAMMLGRWQWSKTFDGDTGKTKRLEALTSEPAKEVVGNEAPCTPVEIVGRFLNYETCFVGMRAAPQSSADRNIANEEKQGYFVFTPFVLDDGTKLMVNRGWIPKVHFKRYKNELASGAGTLPTYLKDLPDRCVVMGVIRPQEQQPAFMSVDNRPYAGKSGVKEWITAAPKWMLDGGDNTGVKRLITSRFVEICDLQSEEVYVPLGERDTLPVTRRTSDFLEFGKGSETHFTYALTWFGFAFVWTCCGLAVNHKRIAAFAQKYMRSRAAPLPSPVSKRDPRAPVKEKIFSPGCVQRGYSFNDITKTKKTLKLD